MAKDDFPVPRDEAPPAGSDAAAEHSDVTDAKPAAKPKPSKRRGPARRKPAAARTARGRTKVDILADVEASLMEAVGTLAVVVSVPAPLTGAYILDQGDRPVSAFVRIAAKNPKMLHALTSTSIATDYIPIVAFGVGLGVAIAAEYGVVPVDGPIAKAYHLDELDDELRRDEERARDDDRPRAEGNGQGPERVPAPALLGGAGATAPA